MRRRKSCASTQIEDHPLHPAPEQGPANWPQLPDKIVRVDSNEMDVRMAQSLLDRHPPERGFFYGVIGGRSLGAFDVVYDPSRPEPVLLGRIVVPEKGPQLFQTWCSFRPRRKGPAFNSSHSISDYRLDTVIHPDLSMTSGASFAYRSSSDEWPVRLASGIVQAICM